MLGNGNCQRAALMRPRAANAVGMLVIGWVLVQSMGVDIARAADRSFAAFGPAGALSPGGTLLAYIVRSGAFSVEPNALLRYTATGMPPEYATGTELRVSNTRTSIAVRVNSGPGAVTQPAWSPDSNSLAFLSDQDGAARAWLWSRETMQSRRVSDAILRPSLFDGASLKWTPDGKRLITSVLSKGTSLKQSDTRAQSAPRDSPQLLSLMSADLAVIQAATGEVKTLARDKAVFWYAPSPDGRWVAFSYPTARAPNGDRWLFNIEAVLLDVSGTRVISESSYADDGWCAWSPDSTRLAYSVSGSRGLDGVHVIDLLKKADKQASNVTLSSSSRVNVHRRVYWSPDGTALYFVFDGKLWRSLPQSGQSALVTAAEWNREVVQIVERGRSGVVWTRDNGRSITVTTRDSSGENMGFYRVDVETGKVTKLREDAKRFGDYLKPAVASDDGTFVMWAAQDDAHPLDLWGAGPNLKDALRLTQLNP